jgi:hypothetical protein
MKKLSLNLDDDIYKLFRIALLKRGETIKAVLLRFILAYIKETEG